MAAAAYKTIFSELTEVNRIMVSGLTDTIYGLNRFSGTTVMFCKRKVFVLSKTIMAFHRLFR